MNQRTHLTVIAACATLMASLPLFPLYSDWSWLFGSIFAVGVTCGALLAARSLRMPLWAQPLIGFVALLFAVTWTHASGHALAGIIPDADTLRYFGALVGDAGTDMRQLAIPVASTPGLSFLTTTGIGVCYVLVDTFAVGIHRPALAGLPMLAIYVVPVAIDQKSVPVLPFVIGACGFLWLLLSDSIDRVRMFGRRFTGDGRGVDMWETSPLASIGRRITVVGIVLAIAVPGIVFPNVGTGLIGVFGNGGSGNGNSTCVGICAPNGHVNLFANLQGKLSQSQEVNMLTVQTDAAIPYYLRFTSVDVLTDKGFPTTPATSGGPLERATPPGPAGTDEAVEQHHAKVTIQDLDQPYLPIYLKPVPSSFTGIGKDWDYDGSTDTLFNPSGSTKGLTYTFTYDAYSPTPAGLRAAAPLPPNSPVMKTAATVPEDVPQVDRVVSTQTQGTTNEYDAVERLYQYFKTNGFTYKLSTKTGTTGTDIGDFLQNKEGYCVQYAAALAWLVRAAHYPARVAFGFTGGTTVTGGSALTYQLTSRNLHAWTEVYFDGFGWVPFDATPSVGIVGSVHNAWENPDQNDIINKGKGASSSASPVTSGNGGPSSHATRPDVLTPGSGPTKSKPTPVWVWWILGLLALAIIVLISPAITRSIIRARRAAADRLTDAQSAQPGEPWVVVDEESARKATTQRVHAVWDEFIDTLIDFDVPIDMSESPRMTAERVVRTTELSTEVATGTRAIGAAEQQARYARRLDQAPSLGPQLRRFRRELSGNVALATRIRATVFPPSVVGRWNQRAANAIGQTSAAMQAVRERIRLTLRVSQWSSLGRRLLASGRGDR